MAVVLDAFSRRVVGWAFNRSLRSTVAVDALQQAIENRKPLPGLVHHSDRGVQYASHDYIELLQKHGATCSMSRVGNPYDNARCESFLKTLKQEEIYCHEYRDLDDLRIPQQRVHRRILQPSTPAFGAWLCFARGFRGRPATEDAVPGSPIEF